MSDSKRNTGIYHAEKDGNREMVLYNAELNTFQRFGKMYQYKESFFQFVGKENLLKNSETCDLCNGRIGLITGYFDYQADAEPYESGKEEEAVFADGEKYISAHKCDNCGNIQGFENQ